MRPGSIFEACYLNNAAEVKELLDDKDEQDNNGLCPSACCAMVGAVDCLNVLIEAGADLNQCDQRGIPPISIAVLEGYPEIVSTLCGKSEVDVDLKDSQGRTALWHACEHGDTRCLSELISTGADCSIPDVNGVPPICVAVGRNHPDCLSLLLSDKGRESTRVDATGPDGMGTAIHVSIQARNLGCLEALLDAGASPNAMSENGATPIEYACTLGHAPSVSLLVSSGADVNEPSIDGTTPLLGAAMSGCLESLHILYSAGVELSATDDNNRNAVHCAARLGRVEAVKALVSLGVPGLAEGYKGRTALMEARSYLPAYTYMCARDESPEDYQDRYNEVISFLSNTKLLERCWWSANKPRMIFLILCNRRDSTENLGDFLGIPVDVMKHISSFITPGPVTAARRRLECDIALATRLARDMRVKALEDENARMRKIIETAGLPLEM